MSDEGFKRLLNPDGSPRDRIVGYETEYGLTCAHEAGRVTPEAAVHAVYRSVFSGRSTYEFKADGDLEYVDVGDHPEVSTAEDIDFGRAAHRVDRGHVKMARQYGSALIEANDRLEAYIGKKQLIQKIHLIANTCDAKGEHWGSHENYLAPRQLEQEDFINPLAIHHLSRIVWSGAGHVLPEGESGFSFVLSERAESIRVLSGGETTRNRPLVNLRDEPLADPNRFRRIHNVAGETVMNPYVNAMRLATGSIVLRACELGVNFDDLMPADPVEAMSQISADPTLRVKISLEDGRQLSGLDLQEAIALRSIVAARQNGYITDQERGWGVRWLNLLDDLKRDPQACARRVNWVTKQRIIDQALTKPRKPGETDLKLAQANSAGYHRLLPREGAGMLLLRKGFFEESPTADLLENGVPLPPTRARLRGSAIAQLTPTGLEFHAPWQGLKLADKVHSTILFPDPYVTESSRLMAMLEEATKRAELEDDCLTA